MNIISLQTYLIRSVIAFILVCFIIYGAIIIDSVENSGWWVVIAILTSLLLTWLLPIAVSGVLAQCFFSYTLSDYLNHMKPRVGFKILARIPVTFLIITINLFVVFILTSIMQGSTDIFIFSIKSYGVYNLYVYLGLYIIILVLSPALGGFFLRKKIKSIPPISIIERQRLYDVTPHSFGDYLHTFETFLQNISRKHSPIIFWMPLLMLFALFIPSILDMSYDLAFLFNGVIFIVGLCSSIWVFILTPKKFIKSLKTKHLKSILKTTLVIIIGNLWLILLLLILWLIGSTDILDPQMIQVN